jgi:exoribonuclease-2
MSESRPLPSGELRALARQAMIDRGLEPDFPPDALRELDRIEEPARAPDGEARDLRHLLWASIDNDDSRDLDQLTVAERLAGDDVRIFVAIADVDALVKKRSAIDRHAERNTTSVYTPGTIFPMLPEKLSTDLTSLGEHEDRLAVVVEMVVDGGGAVTDRGIYRAQVRNQAKLAYNGVAAWLNGEADMPPAMARAPGVDAQIRIQDAVAQRLRRLRHERGALELETIEPRAVVQDGTVVELAQEPKNRSRELIEDFMIAANGASARFLEQRGFPTLRRVVRTPERWDRIVDVARELGERLPHDPDVRALAEFLVRRREVDPLHFPDLSLTIVKLLGSGEYAVEVPGQAPLGHFGLAVRDYSHSTAPNRRYPDLITQRLLKAALAGQAPPYRVDELERLARHCTDKEDDVNRVERQLRKSAAAAFLAPHLGEAFDGIVTGASRKGVWVRILTPPAEGKLVLGGEGADVGDRLRVRLVGTDVARGFIDFARAHR